MNEGFIRWRWQIQDAELGGEMAFNAGKPPESCHYKRRDMVDAWRSGYRKAKEKDDDI